MMVTVVTVLNALGKVSGGHAQWPETKIGTGHTELSPLQTQNSRGPRCRVVNLHLEPFENASGLSRCFINISH